MKAFVVIEILILDLLLCFGALRKIIKLIRCRKKIRRDEIWEYCFW